MTTDTLTTHLLFVAAEGAVIILVFALAARILRSPIRSPASARVLERLGREPAELQRVVRLLLVLGCLALCLLVAAADGYLIYRGERLSEYMMTRAASLPPGSGFSAVSDSMPVLIAAGAMNPGGWFGSTLGPG